MEEQVVAGNLAEGCARGELFLVGGGTARVYAHEGQGHTVDVHAPGVVALHGMSAEGVGDDGGAVQCGFAGGGTCAAIVINHVGLFHDAYAEGYAAGILHLAGSGGQEVVGAGGAEEPCQVDSYNSCFLHLLR